MVKLATPPVKRWGPSSQQNFRFEDSSRRIPVAITLPIKRAESNHPAFQGCQTLSKPGFFSDICLPDSPLAPLLAEGATDATPESITTIHRYMYASRAQNFASS